MPQGVLYIVANEFAERFCYYGINAILTVYMTQFLRLGDADATTYHSLFKSARTSSRSSAPSSRTSSGASSARS